MKITKTADGYYTGAIQLTPKFVKVADGTWINTNNILRMFVSTLVDGPNLRYYPTIELDNNRRCQINDQEFATPELAQIHLDDFIQKLS